MSTFAAVYFCIAAFNNHVVTLELNIADGSYFDALIPIPFMVFVASTWRDFGKAHAGRRTLALRTRYARIASPLILYMAVVGTGLALARTNYLAGVAGVVLALGGYGLRSMLREVGHIEQRARLRNSQVALEALTLIDALTGVANRRALERALERECKAAIRSGQPLGVLLIDIDHFKLLNDTSGHQAGDDGLRTVAQALRAQLRRPEDVLARYGGEEFVVLLPDTDQRGCIKVAQDLRHSIVALRIPNPGAPSKLLSVSIGASCETPLTPDDRQRLLSDADKALYEAKRTGRNRVAVAWPED